MSVCSTEVSQAYAMLMGQIAGEADRYTCLGRADVADAFGALTPYVADVRAAVKIDDLEELVTIALKISNPNAAAFPMDLKDWEAFRAALSKFVPKKMRKDS